MWGARRRFEVCCLVVMVLLVSIGGVAQETAVGSRPVHTLRARRFLAGREQQSGTAVAGALDAARRQHLAMAEEQAAESKARTRAQAGVAAPRLNPLSTAWQAVGPMQVASQRYGNVSGRVTSVAIDPADATGNTVYVGTTGGGVWKSTNAAGAAASVAFTPLTDTLPVFSGNSGATALPSLSIGALSVNGGVVLAGTGDPNDGLDSYYGQGILRSTDGGVTWTLAQGSNDGSAGSHSFVGLGVAGFAWSGLSPKLVVMGVSQSAEGVLVNAPDTSFSVMGLYYSADAGVTWQMATVMDGSQIVQRPTSGGGPGNAATAVVWNAVRQRFYAAVRYHGYYETTDGKTWIRSAQQPGTGLTTTACPANPGSTGSASCPIFRGALAVQEGTGDTFALTVDANNSDHGLWQDVCGLTGASCATSPIAFGKQLSSSPLEVGSGSTRIAQADYDLALAAVGSGTDTLLYVGTSDLYRCSLAAGCVLRNTTNAVNGCSAPAKVSPAQHAIAVLAGAGTSAAPLLFVGNDGGLWRSLDGVNEEKTPCSSDDATHFDNLNAGIGSLAEVVSFAEDPNDASTLLVGLGGNGTAATGTSSGGGVWPQIATGEGGTVAIDQTSAQNWFVSIAAGVNVRYCGTGNTCAAADFTGAPTIGYAQVSNDASVINPPFLLDPALTSNVVIGTCRVWRGAAQSGTTWPGSNAISTMFGGPQNSACNAASNPGVRSLAAGGPASGAVAAQNAGSTVLYAGLAGALDGGGNVGGHVFVTSAAGSATASAVWTDVAKSTVTNDVANGGVFNPGSFDVSSLLADPHDNTGETVYATVMGFAGNGTNAPHLYRSINGGASWINISGNLPNAPANGVVVDPNDANTIYVATDVGVYVTTQVTTCATADCWSLYGTGLPNAPAVALQAATGLATGDGRYGELRVATYGRGIWQIPLLTAKTAAAPAMTLSPTSLSFSTQAVATASAPKTITVTNSGTAALTVSQMVATGDFSETDTCTGIAISVGGACAVQVKFLPTAKGTREGVLTVYGNVAGGQATATLNGTGAPPAAIILSPISVTYPGTNVGAVSAAQNITISNTGGFTVSLQTPVVDGDFVITANTCGPTLATNVGCTVSVAFEPTASGTRTGSFSITDDVGTQTASLSGQGLLPATDALAPLTLSFGAQQLNTASATQQVTLTNAGDAALTLVSAKVTSGDFTAVNGCGNSLSGHSSCSLVVAFVPKSVGAGAGVLTVGDQYRSQTVNLSGTGVAPPGVSLSPVSGMTFAATPVGTTATAQTLTLTNNGGMPLLIQSLGLTGDFSIVTGSSTCGSTLAVGAACTAQIVFTPTAGGARSGTLTLVDNAASSPQSIQLAGVGVDFTLSANGSTTASVSAGAQAVYPLLLTSGAAVPGTVTFSCSGAPAYSTCLVTPGSEVLGGTATVTVTVTTAMASLELPGRLGDRPMIWAVGLLPLGLAAVGRRRLRGAVVLCCLLVMMGCSASRLIPGSGSGSSPGNSTPSGTYNLTASGTSAGLTRSVGLTLVVK